MSNSRNALHAASLIAVVLAMLWGCAGTPRPIIDTKDTDMGQYQVDLAECEQYADEIDVVGGMARSAAVGALIGVAMGAITGDVGPAAGLGAIGGGAGAGLEEARNKQSVVKECLRGRGYRVLN
jgi:outer membrane lipoprotein SlyB